MPSSVEMRNSLIGEKSQVMIISFQHTEEELTPTDI